MTGVHGVLLFIKAQHSLKLIVYLKRNKRVGREKTASFLYKTSWLQPHTHAPCHRTFQAQIELIGRRRIPNKWWVDVTTATDGQPRSSVLLCNALKILYRRPDKGRVDTSVGIPEVMYWQNHHTCANKLQHYLLMPVPCGDVKRRHLVVRTGIDVTSSVQ